MQGERSMVRNLPAICDFGRYELLGRLAVGGMAEIYLAREPESVVGAGHRHLVIKRILSHVADDPTFTTMFFDEARLAMRLNHPSIVHIYEFGEEQGSYFLAMEWVDGVALGKLIRRGREHGGIPAPLAVKVVAQVAEALHYAHHLRGDDGQPLNIVHRDVSPQNIMVSYDGAVKLLDFGIAKATIQHTKTGDGQVKGKFAYMSPQQCLGEPVDGRADVFALGVILYEALTGLPLYHRKTQYETMRAVIEDAVPSIRTHRPDLPEELDRIVRVALSKKPEGRFPTAGDMQIALERWLAVEQEVVPARRLTELLQTVFGEDIRRGPMVDSTPFGQSFQLVEDAKLTPPPSSSAPPPEAPQLLPPPADIDSISAELLPDSDSAPISVPMVAPSYPPPNAPVVSSHPPPASSPPSAPTASSAPLSASYSPSAMPTDSELSSRRALFIVVGVIAGLAIVFGGVALWWMNQRTQVAGATAPVPVRGPDGVLPTPVETVMAGQPVPTMQAETPAVERGALLFRSEPPGATVQLGEREVPGVTPTALYDLEPGPYDVTIRLSGHRTWSGDAEVRAGRETTVDATLRTRGSGMAMTMAMMAEPMAAAPGRISINTRPWSKVYVGARLLGTTPIGRAEVPSGRVSLRIVDRDGNEHQRAVQIEAGGEERVFFNLTGIE